MVFFRTSFLRSWFRSVRPIRNDIGSDAFQQRINNSVVLMNTIKRNEELQKKYEQLKNKLALIGPYAKARSSNDTTTIVFKANKLCMGHIIRGPERWQTKPLL